MKLSLAIFTFVIMLGCSHSKKQPESSSPPKSETSNDKNRQVKKKTRSEKPAEKPATSSFRKDENDLLEKGNQYAVDGLYREALQAYSKILKKNDTHTLAHRMVGVISVKIGEYRKAIKHLELIIDQRADDFEANYYLAEAYRTQDRYGDAIFRYKVALTQKPNHVLSLKALAWSYYKIRYYRAALRTAHVLYKQEPDDMQVTIILARVLNKVGQPKKAMLRLRKTLLKAPKDQAPYLKSVLGDVYLSIGNREKAEEAYRDALKDQPLLAGALLGLAKLTLQAGERPDIAITYLERATRIKPSLVEAYYYLGQAYLKTKPKVSQKYFQKFNRLAAGDPEFNEQVSEVREFFQKVRKTPSNSELESLDSQL
ncbi:tetratricopeptide repeat protein [Pseudobacteriovorax antillogorgiicola]|uniref:Tetratricopeptide repeat-containing protein n=1 Tax=Pseudobacteriovorax antillogorgiicola TaxID=1513793 RepID=A0A1Y6B4X6_9BACT|nr:tetratricopeptide repeat protein [Pseudobacteriovorax antillogorgiicola]TCS59299.1 tetratricopeptide repeat protein [Pseudobacteriovorax antillogorgiicola]SME89610.1 Tetratricopeptide repeat-containing protein [Pseudobacteriovorax antillogorgiicola]